MLLKIGKWVSWMVNLCITHVFFENFILPFLGVTDVLKNQDEKM